MPEHESESDPTTLSFVDVVSCGLAATILLFLIYTALPRNGHAERAADSRGRSELAGWERGVPRHRSSVAITLLTVDVGPVPPGTRAVWTPTFNGCEALESRRAGGHVTFLQSCPQGFDGSKALHFKLDPPLPPGAATHVAAHAWVGGEVDHEACPSNSVQRAGESLVTFRLTDTTCPVEVHAP